MQEALPMLDADYYPGSMYNLDAYETNAGGANSGGSYSQGFLDQVGGR